METTGPQLNKPTSIRSIGLVLILFSAFIIFSNSMGALSFNMMDNAPHDALWDSYTTMCFTMVVIGSVCMVGAIYLRKYRLWASRLVSAVSVVLIIGIWWLMATMALALQHDPKVKGLWLFPFLVAAAFSTPLALLIRFLNRRSIVQHFG